MIIARENVDEDGHSRTLPIPVRSIITISVVSVGLYIINYLLLRSISTIGLPAATAVFHSVPSPGRAVNLIKMLTYLVVTTLIFIAYARVLAMARAGHLLAHPAKTWALVVPCIISVLFIPCIPSMSQDLYSYMAHGFLGTVPGDNPLTQAATTARHTAIGSKLAYFGWDTEAGITPYGVVWTQIEVAVMKICGTNLLGALLLLKSIVVAASLGSAYLIWVFLGRVHPAAQLTGTLAYLWNPLILVEFAGEGHNDAVTLFFVVAALAACVTRRTVISTVTQLLAILTKYVPILFAPGQLMFMWRARRSTTQLAVNLALALIVTGTIAAILYVPVWAGSHSFDGLLQRGQPLSSASIFGGINWMLRRSPLAAHAGILTIGLITLPALAFILWISLRVTDVASLARSFAWISISYVLFASPDFWPWYACVPVALILIAGLNRLYWLAMLLSFSARVCAPLELLYDQHLLSMQVSKGLLTGLGATAPLLALVIWLFRQKRPLLAFGE